MYSGEYDACDVTLSVYPHWASLTQFRKISYSNRPDRAAQLAEHWASIPKAVGSIPTVARHIFQAYPVWIYTQSNTTRVKLTLFALDYSISSKLFFLEVQ